jgi:hypothetical protein
MEVSLDFGDILSGLAALLTAYAALRERKRKRESAPRSNDSETRSRKLPVGRHPSDSDCIRLSELLESSNDENGNGIWGKPRNRGLDDGEPPPR